MFLFILASRECLHWWFDFVLMIQSGQCNLSLLEWIIFSPFLKNKIGRKAMSWHTVILYSTWNYTYREQGEGEGKRDWRFGGRKKLELERRNLSNLRGNPNDVFPHMSKWSVIL